VAASLRDGDGNGRSKGFVERFQRISIRASERLVYVFGLKMKTIGLIGGVASGKSRVAQMLAELGAGVLDADRVSHVVLAEDSTVHEALRRRWGEDVFTSDGRVDRGAIAKRVFGAGENVVAEREFLEGLLHPKIRERLVEQARELAEQGVPAIVLDAPLLLEAGWNFLCDVVLLIDASRENRLARVRIRGWSEVQFDQREAAQWPIVKKRGAADVVLNNDGTEEQLREAVLDFWNEHIALQQ